jgi:hypothetical protein
MAALQRRQAFGLMLRCAPVLGQGLVVRAGIALAYALAIAAGVVLGDGLDGIGAGVATGWPGFAGGALGFALAVGARRGVRAQLHHLVEARRVAVLALLLDDHPVPGGRGQAAFAAAIVGARFGDAPRLFALVQLVKGIVRACNRALPAPSGPHRLPALRLASAGFDWALPHFDALILAHAIRSRQANPWAAVRDGTVLFAEHQHRLLPFARRLAVYSWLLAAGVLVAALSPAAGVLAGVPGPAGFWTFALAAIAALTIKVALIDPWALTCLLQAWTRIMQGQQPRQAWATRLNATAGGFRVLGERALAWVERQPDPVYAARTAGLPFPERIG